MCGVCQRRGKHKTKEDTYSFHMFPFPLFFSQTCWWLLQASTDNIWRCFLFNHDLYCGQVWNLPLRSWYWLTIWELSIFHNIMWFSQYHVIYYVLAYGSHLEGVRANIYQTWALNNPHLWHSNYHFLPILISSNPRCISYRHDPDKSVWKTMFV